MFILQTLEKFTGGKTDLSAMKAPEIPYFGVKESVFPFNMFPEVDPLLGPEMRSTGEVLGLSGSFGLAFFKAYEASKALLPLSGSVLISVAKGDREEAAKAAKLFAHLGFKIIATSGTRAFLAENGIEAGIIKKINEGRPNIEDEIKNHQLDLIINTPSDSKQSNVDDSYIRKAAIRYNIPYLTTLTAAMASAMGIGEKLKKAAPAGSGENAVYDVLSLQEYHQLVNSVSAETR
jgi:carbamoyl-phosphate synthase large subunit